MHLATTPGIDCVASEVAFPLVYSFRNNEKRARMFGLPCRVVARGRMNSILIEFKDGTREVVSRNSVRRQHPTPLPT